MKKSNECTQIARLTVSFRVRTAPRPNAVRSNSNSWLRTDLSLVQRCRPKRSWVSPPRASGSRQVAISFLNQAAKTEAEETAERTEVEERKRFAKEARERTVAVLVLASLGIAAAAEPRSAGRPTSQMMVTRQVKKKMPRWWRQTLGATLPLCSTQCACGQPLSKLQEASARAVAHSHLG